MPVGVSGKAGVVKGFRLMLVSEPVHWTDEMETENVEVRCDRCRHWNRLDTSFVDSVGVTLSAETHPGVLRVYGSCSVICYRESMDPGEDGEKDMAAMLDPSSWPGAQLSTVPDFGCALFEAKP